MTLQDQRTVEVKLLPSGQTLRTPLGSTLADALLAAGISLPMDCGGKGVCGSCLVLAWGALSPPEPAEQKLLDERRVGQGFRLACRCRALGDVALQPPENRDQGAAGWLIDEAFASDDAPVDSPVIDRRPCDPPVPTLQDPRDDARRLAEALDGAARVSDPLVAGQLSRLARRQAWRLDAYLRSGEVVGVGRRGQTPLGLAVDLGSTKLAAYLLDLQTGVVLAAKGRLNPQIVFGADVITRLQRAISSPSDGRRLTAMVREAIDALAGDLAHGVDVDRQRICEMTLVGNTAMVHILLGLPLEQLGAPPFVASLGAPLDIKAREIGLDLAPGAWLHLPPLVGGFVGSDNVAMIMGADLDQADRCRLGLDIGTNTEVVLSVPGRAKPLLIASAPSGPTFEGAHLSSGMRALTGAIHRVRIDNGQGICQTIDGGAPAGICGSGVIDAMAALRVAGLIDHRGRLQRPADQTADDGRLPRFVLAPAAASATGQEIALTQADISQVQLAKAAIRAAAQTLLAQAGLDEGSLAEVVLAGSFGSHFEVESARRIGLIPDVPGATYRQVGNAAGKGVRMALTGRRARERAAAIPAMADYVELAGLPDFNRVFARSLAFPPLPPRP